MLERVRDILKDYVKVERESINMDTELISDLGLSSLDVVNIVIAFEDAFDIEIPDRTVEKLITIGDIVEYLEKNV